LCLSVCRCCPKAKQGDGIYFFHFGVVVFLKGVR
jgi:hypothetical protein